MTSRNRHFRRACIAAPRRRRRSSVHSRLPGVGRSGIGFHDDDDQRWDHLGRPTRRRPQRRAVFVADGDSWSKKINGRVWPVPRPLNPKIAVLNADTRRVTRTIDYLPLPAGSMNAYGVKIPSPQVPAGLALDTRRGLIVTTNAQSNGAAIVPMTARAARPSDIVRGSDGPLAHPMGTTVDPVTGLALHCGVQP